MLRRFGAALYRVWVLNAHPAGWLGNVILFGGAPSATLTILSEPISNWWIVLVWGLAAPIGYRLWTIGWRATRDW